MRTIARPWLRSGDLRPAARRLALAHENFLTGTTPAGVRPEVLDSWRRSLRSGVNPELNLPPVDIDTDELEELRRGHPLAPVMPIVRRLLVGDATDAGLVVAVGDADGRLLWVEGDARLRRRAESMHFVEGARWDESHAGTNAPGTALALDHEVQIFAAEHFASNVAPWSCAAAPIHDPLTGVVLGVLDVTGDDTVVVPQTPALVRATVAAVEAELTVNSLTRDLGRRAGPRRRTTATLRLSVLGRRRALLSAPRGNRVLTPRHSELVLLLSEHPEGLTADAAAVLLHEQDPPSVTVRAELSRLRSQYPELALLSRPYRLGVRPSTDVAEVHRLLDTGQLREALRRCPGPVLPDSQSPEVVRLREELRGHVRAAVIERGDPGLLLERCQDADAHDDVVLWRACLGVLPPDSPRRAGVVAHLEQLDRELGGG
jgi:transcriptional regulator of acetoin/glycerol metabolism